MKPERRDIIDDFLTNGVAILDDLVDPHTARGWGEQLLRSDRLHYVCTPSEYRVVDAGEGDNEHYSLDRFEIDAIVSGIGAAYGQVFHAYIDHLNPNSMRSPYERSAYYAKVYKAGCLGQGWHYDTNSYSGILYLSDSDGDDGATEILARDGSTELVPPRAGRLLLLDGRRCWHRATRVARGNKVTILLNYYDTGHRPRDPRTDPLIFGS